MSVPEMGGAPGRDPPQGVWTQTQTQRTSPPHCGDTQRGLACLTMRSLLLELCQHHC